MTRRLAVLYAFSASAILVLVTALPYWWLSRRMEVEDTQVLAGRLEELGAMLTEGATPQAIGAEADREATTTGPGLYLARVIGPDGRTVLQRAGMATVLPATAFPGPDAIGRPASATWHSAGKTYLLMAVRVATRTASDQRRPWLVQVALDRTREQALEHAYRDGLVVAALAGLAASAAAGFLVARRALRPLADITHAAARITSSRLDKRLGELTDSGAWPEELAALRVVFDEMLGRLEDSFRRLQQVSADLAHELRTPIAKLRGEAEVALARERTAMEYRGVLESALEEYSRLSTMIEALLFLARAESGRAALAVQRISLNEEAIAAMEFYQPLADATGVALSVTGDAVVQADPPMVRHAAGNLLANALRHTPEGGRVEVLIETTPAGTWFRVRDTGTGISAQHLARVCDRFYRVDDARSGDADGAGLGLALVRSIVELHGGRVDIVSEVGRGTTVSLLFPSG